MTLLPNLLILQSYSFVE